MSFSPASCPVCGSIGARALMLDHIEAEPPGPLRSARVTADMVERAAPVIERMESRYPEDVIARAALTEALR